MKNDNEKPAGRSAVEPMASDCTIECVEETPWERAESVAQEFLGITAREAFERLEREEIEKWTIAYAELTSLRWVMGGKGA